MATTFKRIQTLIHQTDKKVKWADSDELAEYVRNLKMKDFQTKKVNLLMLKII